MSTFIQEKVDIIDQYLTEYRTSPEAWSHSELMSIKHFFKTEPDNFIEEVTRFIYYDQNMRYWMQENIQADISELSQEILSIYLRYQWPTITFNAIEELKTIIPEKKIEFILEEIKELIKNYS